MSVNRWMRKYLMLLLMVLPKMEGFAVVLSFAAETSCDETDTVSSDSVCDETIGRVDVFQWKRRSSAELGISWGHVLSVDRYQRQWLHETPIYCLNVGWRHRTRSDESDDFAADYGYPEWALHLMWGNYSGVKMQKYPSADWGQLLPVDYASDMGHIMAGYASFSRPLQRKGGVSWGYAFETGVAYNTRPYNSDNNIDNELTGSHLLFYFGAGPYVAVNFGRWGLRLDLPFRHVSNGALDRPNKGANSFSPQLAVQVDLDESADFSYSSTYIAPPFSPHSYFFVSGSLGGRTLLEDWVLTQYGTAPSAPDYRRENFEFHPTYNLQFDFMRRYARRWASGIGADVFYMPYIGKVRRHDAIYHPDATRHHHWSAGLALKHEAFYGRLSMYLHLGVYLFRQTGAFQRLDETPYYERVGVRYRLPFERNRWSLGVGIKAHKTKADFSEITLSRRW